MIRLELGLLMVRVMIMFVVPIPKTHSTGQNHGYHVRGWVKVIIIIIGTIFLNLCLLRYVAIWSRNQQVVGGA